MKKSNQLRIIGGQWRSRKLSFADIQGLRPTTDRIRETLFNWLAPHIQGARVLDVFAGSGALVLEAMSRGAQSALALERNDNACRHIQNNLQLLQCADAKVVCTDSLQFLASSASETFHIALIDPPFNQQLLEPACKLLEDNNWLADDALIYLESEQSPGQLQLPDNWYKLREKTGKQLNYGLWQRRNKNTGIN